MAWMLSGEVNLALGVSIYKPGAEDIADSSSRLPRVGSFERKVKKPRMSIEKLA